MIIHSLIIWVNAVVVIPSALFHAIRDLMVPIMATHLQDEEFLPKFSWICWPNYTYENVILGGSCHWWDFFFLRILDLPFLWPIIVPMCYLYYILVEQL